MSVRPSLSHLGLNVRDLEGMAAFYTSVLGMVVTDRGVGKSVPQSIVFLSSDAAHHHQLVLVTGRGEDAVSTVNQVSFLVENLDGLREMKARAEAAGRSVNAMSHGNAWSIYFPDPEDNVVEIYVDTPWYAPQPHAHKLDLSMTDDEVFAKTEAECRADAGFQPVGAWRDGMRTKLK